MNGPDRKLNTPIGEALRSTVTGAATITALLLVPAGLIPGGTWLWPRALWLIGVHSGITLAGNVALAIWRPAHFRVRQQSVVAIGDKKQPLIDAIGSAGLLAFAAAWLAFIPIDVFRLQLLPQPSTWVQWGGGLAVVVGTVLTPLAVWENRFATPNVQDQTGDGQGIVETGVYGLVRHPIYLGNLLLAAGVALWLGSYAGLVGFAVLAVATAWRIVIEETELRRRLPAYSDYARRVRGRLIPFLL